MTRVLVGRQPERQPFDLARESVSEDVLRDALGGLFSDDQLEGMFSVPDKIAEFAFGLSTTPEGRELFEWILDCTIRMPYRPTGATLEATALNAARREGLNASAEMLLAAISRGEKSIMARSSGARQ